MRIMTNLAFVNLITSTILLSDAMLTFLSLCNYLQSM